MHELYKSFDIPPLLKRSDSMPKNINQEDLFLQLLEDLNGKYNADEVIFIELKATAVDYHKNHGLAKMQAVDVDLFNTLRRKARKILFSMIKSAAAENSDYVPIATFLITERHSFDYFISAYVHDYYSTHITIARIADAIKNGKIKSDH